MVEARQAEVGYAKLHGFAAKRPRRIRLVGRATRRRLRLGPRLGRGTHAPVTRIMGMQFVLGRTKGNLRRRFQSLPSEQTANEMAVEPRIVSYKWHVTLR